MLFLTVSRSPNACSVSYNRVAAPGTGRSTPGRRSASRARCTRCGSVNCSGFVFHIFAPGPRKYAITTMPPRMWSPCKPGQREVDRQERAVPRPLAACEVVGVLEVLVDQEDAGEHERGDQIQAVLGQVVQLQRRPRHHHRDRRADQDERVDHAEPARSARRAATPARRCAG